MRELVIKEDGKQIGMFRVIDVEPPITSNLLNIKHIIAKKIEQKKHFYSIEVSPLASTEDLNYKELIVQPIFTSITWFTDANVTTLSAAEAPAIKLASIIKHSNAVLSHVTCTKLTCEKLTDILSNNVENVLALRGDHRSENQPMNRAIELVRELRQSSTELTIAVAGYPQIHPDALSREIDLENLKEKVDAGADFIITQICFSFDDLASFIKSCRAIGITCAIIPGIFVPTSYPLLMRLSEICRITIPSDHLEQYAAVKDNDDKFSQLALLNAFQLIDQIYQWDFEELFGIHIHTVNKYQCVKEILTKYEELLKVD